MIRSSASANVLMAVGVAVITATGCEPGERQLSDSELTEIAAQHLDVQVADLELLGRTDATYRWSGQTVTAVKLQDVRDGTGFEIAITPSRVVIDDIVGLVQADRDSFVQRYGNLEPALFDTLSALPQDQQLRIGVWLRTQPRRAQATDRVREGDDMDRMRAGRRRLLQVSHDTTRALVQRFDSALAGIGIQAQYRSSTAPLVFLTADAQAIRSTAQLAEVEFIYLARVGEDLNNTAIPSVSGSAWATGGFDGAGVRVAIIEDDGIDFSNPNLAPAFAGRFQADNSNLGHPTQTAGVAASRHDVYRGMAPTSLLLSANAGTYAAADIIAATDWALDSANADVLNCSFGYPVGNANHDLIARYFDHVVWNEWRSVTPAAGNSGTTLGAPGVAYNVLSIGGIDDTDTPWHGDDGIYGNTSWQDPPSTHSDREKPEVSAVAMRILTTEDSTYGRWITSPGAGYNGTSYAAPAVAGAIARLIDRKGFLFTWPEEVKAIVMASAVRNVFDATVDTDNPTVDVKEGVGTIVVPLAEKIVGMNWHLGTYLTSSSFPYNHFFYAEEGDTVRLVIAWDAHTDVSYSTVSLEADLDLHVYDPGGNRIAYSISWDNPYEIVEFAAPSTGNYRAWVRDWRFDGTYEWLGLAWSRR